MRLWIKCESCVVFLTGILVLLSLFLQYEMGLIPCHLCIIERYMHLMTCGVAVLTIFYKLRLFKILIIISLLCSICISMYHTSVELHLLPGPSGCTLAKAMSSRDLLEAIQSAPVVRCDEPAMKIIGISLVGWNVIASAMILLIYIYCGHKTKITSRQM